jgi:hypothetical protein
LRKTSLNPEQFFHNFVIVELLIRLSIIKKIFLFYYDGFKGMTIGRRLWTIILIKLFIMFIILKLIFFPNLLKKNFSDDRQRSDYVLEQLTKSK